MLVKFVTKDPGYVVNTLDDRIEYIYSQTFFDGWVVLVLLLNPRTSIEEIESFSEEMAIGGGERRVHMPKILNEKERVKAIAEIKERKVRKELEAEELAEQLDRAIRSLVEKSSYRRLVRESAESGVLGKFYKAKYGNLSNRDRNEICKEVWTSFKQISQKPASGCE